MIQLSDGGITATLDPSRGAAVTQIITPHGQRVLWAPPATVRDLLAKESVPPDRSGQMSWLERGGAGWEIMSPNAGPGVVVDGVFRQFHGEAGRASWTVTNQEGAACSLSVADPFGVFRHERRVRVTPDTVAIDEIITNISGRDAALAWGSHLAFGGDMIDGDVLVDHNGVLLGPVSTRSRGGTSRGVSPDEAYVDYFEFPRHPLVTVFNEAKGLHASVSWDSSAFPRLWFWVETGGTRGWPWFGQVRALGIEPVSHAPDDHSAQSPIPPRDRQILRPGQTHVGRVELSLQWKVASS